MSEDIKKVVVIQDASRSISSSAIKWAIEGLSLKPGDEVTLLGILHQVNTPMGYKIRVDATSMLGANQKVIKEEIMRKELEYQNSTEILEISKLYEMNKIAFHRKIVPASSPKVTALEAAKELGATWIILDRQMKKDKKYFMEKLSCGISRMKRNDSVELLRGPKAVPKNVESRKENQSRHVNSNEKLPAQELKGETFLMMQGTPEDDDLFSLEIFPSSSRCTYNNSTNDENNYATGQEIPGNNSHTNTFSTSTSYEAISSFSIVSSPDQINLASSYFKEAVKPFQFQEDEHEIIQKAASDNDAASSISNDGKIASIGSNRFIIQHSGQEHINTTDGIITNEFTNKNPNESPENSACSECTNEQWASEFKKDFTYAELHAATDGFSRKNFISEGGFGSVYKGFHHNGQRIAVKQHKHVSLQGEKEFRSEVNVLSKARHKNVVMLLGSCSEGNHRLLVYEYICNGSLDIHLSKNNPNVLSWKNRMNIAVGVARGLNYLHQKSIIHRDMRPNNILINHDYEPLVADFGLAKAQQDESDSLSENKVVGTFGYLAPEYAEKGRVSTKSDVYSFGVVLLELITGRTTMDKSLAEKSLVGWARPLLKEKKYPELIDERILDCHDVHELFWMVRVAEKCLHNDPDKRPSMDKVEDALKCIISGETVSAIEDFSPDRSSDSSFQRSNDSDSGHETELQKHAITDVPSASRSQATESGSASTEQSKSKPLSWYTNFDDSQSVQRKSFKKERRSPKVLYNEMLD